MVSFPHFYLGDPRLLEEVEGLKPDPEKHDFYLDVHEVRFYILLTVHLRKILVNNQLDALFSMYLFISLPYMFRATQCSSSGESNSISTSAGIYHFV